MRETGPGTVKSTSSRVGLFVPVYDLLTRAWSASLSRFEAEVGSLDFDIWIGAEASRDRLVREFSEAIGRGLVLLGHGAMGAALTAPTLSANTLEVDGNVHGVALDEEDLAWVGQQRVFAYQCESYGNLAERVGAEGGCYVGFDEDIFVPFDPVAKTEEPLVHSSCVRVIDRVQSALVEQELDSSTLATLVDDVLRAELNELDLESQRELRSVAIALRQHRRVLRPEKEV